MFSRNTIFLSLASVALALSAHAGPIVSVLNANNEFGTVDVSTGAFRQIGMPFTPPDGGDLSPGPNGSLVSLSFAGNLYSINPGSGAASLIGSTGLANCTLPTDTCGPTAANIVGNFGSATYATDFANNLYSLNPATGKATLIGPTGIPALPFIPLTNNPDGSFNFYDATLFSAGGNFYATFDAGTFNPATSVSTTVIPNALYRINQGTGRATLVASLDLGISSIVAAEGKVYAFSGSKNQIFSLDVSNGNMAFVSNLDPAAGLIVGAAATPEPGSILLSILGLGALSAARFRRRVI